MAQRLEAKFERDYATADQIREQLQNEYDVKVDDRKRKWMVGDRPFRGAPDLNAPYTRRGGGEVEDVSKVEELVEERADAKARRDYAAADAIVSRAGAGTLSELCLIGKPALLIPSPNVAEDHQTHNAMALSEKNAAILVKEKEMDNLFLSHLATLKDPDTAKNMGTAIKSLALPKATEDIADLIDGLSE